MKILLCSFAVPTPQEPEKFTWNLSQAQALTALGAPTTIFRPTLRVPRFLARLNPRLQRQADIPLHYELEGIHFYAPRVYFAHPGALRYTIAERCPALMAPFARSALGPALSRALKDLKPDVLLIDHARPWGPVALKVAKPANVPFAFIEHAVDEFQRLNPGMTLTRHYQRAMESARAVFAVGDMMQHCMQAVLRLNNIICVSNGVTPLPPGALANPRPPDLQGTFIILSGAHYLRKKGFEELVQAFAHVAGQHPDAHLHMVTGAPASLVTLAQTSPFASRIHIHPPMRHAELMQWMVWADLFAMPSWSDTLPTVFGEALLAQTAIITTHECGFSYKALAAGIPGESPNAWGWVVDPRNVPSLAKALSAALEDRPRLAAMGKAGQAFAQRNLTWEQNARTVLAGLGDGGTP